MPEFTNLRKKVRRRRIETILLAGYAVAVTCALFVSMLNKGETPVREHQFADESYDFNGNDVMTPAFNDTQDNPFNILYAQVNNIRLLSDDETLSAKYKLSQNGQTGVVMPIQSKPKVFAQTGSFEGIYQKERRVIVVAPGDNFIGILTNLGMETQSATNAYNTLKKVYDARKLKAGQHIELTATFDVQSKALEALDTLVIEPVRGTKYILQINEYDQFEAKVEQEKFAYEIKDVKGTVSGNVSAALNKAGLPYKLCGKVTQMFGQVIDFRRDVKKGDSFNVKYEINKTASGEVVSVGDVIFASFTLGKQTYKLYRYKARDGSVDYYDEKGGAKKTGLDKKPLAMRNARISSLFGYRRHPIYKTSKFHSGVDYAAPKGTAIYASGAGTIEIARYVNGYGNFIKIRHNSEYQTAYGHMHKFAAGMRPGIRVKKGQIIGYVGSTGRSTGPHLHFEILRKGQRIDPLKAKVATGNDLTGRQLAEFKRVVKQVDSIKTAEQVSPVQDKKNNPSTQNVTTEKVLAEKQEVKQPDTVVKKEEKASAGKTAAKQNTIVVPDKKDVFANVNTTDNAGAVLSAEKNNIAGDSAAENRADADATVGQPVIVSENKAEDIKNNEEKIQQAAEEIQVKSDRKPLYPSKTPLRKRKMEQALNAKALDIVNAISRKPKRK